jgi:myo-inositol 2-dehydrogenase/D-chiro-inositol 1-dehydrogenase
MNAPLRIRIAGIGRTGQRHAMNLAHRTLGAELVAACSPVAAELQWAREKLGVEHSYRDYTELLALNIADCLKDEREAAKVPKQKVTIGFVRRFNPSYPQAHDKVQRA